MVKDIVVNLTGGAPQDFAADYAVSLARLFDAHIAGVGFVYEPVIPGTVLGGIPTDLIEAQREENAKAAKAATDRFEAAAKRAGVSAEVRLLDASVAGAADLFGRIARRFDLAVVGQARPREGASEELLIEGVRHGDGERPVLTAEREDAVLSREGAGDGLRDELGVELEPVDHRLRVPLRVCHP